MPLYWDKISITGWQWIEPIFVWLILPLDLAKGKESKWNDVSTESLVPFFNTSFTGTVCWQILDFGMNFWQFISDTCRYPGFKASVMFLHFLSVDCCALQRELFATRCQLGWRIAWTMPLVELLLSYDEFNLYQKTVVLVDLYTCLTINLV